MILEEENLILNTTERANGYLINMDVFLDIELPDQVEALDCFCYFAQKSSSSDDFMVECLFMVKWDRPHVIGNGKTLWRSDQ